MGKPRCCWGLILSLLASSAALAQSHELSLRYVEFASATQPVAPAPEGDAGGNVGSVVSPSQLSIPMEVPSDARTVREAKLGVNADAPFLAAFGENKVVWRMAGRLGPVSDPVGQVRVDLQVDDGRGTTFNTIVLLTLGKDQIVTGLIGPTTSCWVARLDPRASGK